VTLAEAREDLSGIRIPAAGRTLGAGEALAGVDRTRAAARLEARTNRLRLLAP
jgi:hypothetical protein